MSDDTPAWAVELLGDDAYELQEIGAQTVDDFGMTLHMMIVMPVESARDWINTYIDATEGQNLNSQLILWDFLHTFALQLEEGVDQDPEDDWDRLTDDDYDA